MIKKGFTLAEVLITLGIIGVIAALTVPHVIANLPCENKLRFLQSHAALTNTINDLMSDETFYYTSNLGGVGLNRPGHVLDPDLQNHPLVGQNFILDNPPTSANEKLARLVAFKMHIVDGPINCVNDTCTFDTTNGVNWSFAENNDNNGDNVSTVTIDVNTVPDDDNNVDTTFNNAPNDADMVDRFEFVIDQWGGITPTSQLETRLLAEPSNLKMADFKALITELKHNANAENVEAN